MRSSQIWPSILILAMTFTVNFQSLIFDKPYLRENGPITVKWRSSNSIEC